MRLKPCIDKCRKVDRSVLYKSRSTKNTFSPGGTLKKMSTCFKCGRPQANFKENVRPQLPNEFPSCRIKHGELANQVHLEVIFTYSTALRHAACLAFQFTVPVTSCDACADNAAWIPSSNLPKGAVTSRRLSCCARHLIAGSIPGLKGWILAALMHATNLLQINLYPVM